jgi:hypothetical protein
VSTKTSQVDIALQGHDQASEVFAHVEHAAQHFGEALEHHGHESALSFASLNEILGELSPGFAAVGAAIAGGPIRMFLALVEGAKKLFEASSEAEDAQIRLKSALELAGDAGAKSLPELLEYSDQVEKMTRLSHVAVEEAMRLGASVGGFTGENLKSATTAAIGLSEKLGIDLDGAMRLIVNASEGSTNGLKRYGISLDETLSPQDKFNELLRVGTDAFSLAQARTETAGGAMARFGNAVTSQLEHVGSSFGGALAGAINFATGIVDKIGPAFDFVMEKAQPAMDAVESAIGTAFHFIVDEVGPILVAEFHAWWAVVSTLADLVWTGATTIVSAMESVAEAVTGVTPSWRDIRDGAIIAFTAIEFAVTHWKDAATIALAQVLYENVRFSNEVTHAFTVVIPAALKWLADNWREILLSLASVASNTFLNLSANVEAFFKNLPGLMKGTVDFSTIWKPITDGFEIHLKSLPQIAARHESELEASLHKLRDTAASSFGDGLLNAIGQRLEAAKSPLLDKLKSLFESASPKAPEFSAVDLKIPEKIKHEHTVNIQQKQASLDESRFLTGVRARYQEDSLNVAKEQLAAAKDMLDRADAQQKSLDTIATNTTPQADDSESIF